MRKILAFVCALMPLLVSAQLVAKSTKSSTGVFIGFYQYTPSGWSTSTEKYPVIIFLHGVGERGNGTTELYRVKNVAIPKYIDRGTKTMRYYVNGKWQSFVVLCPQLSESYGSWQNFYVDAMIDYAVKYLKGDPNRIILTGLSLGGGGVWKYASSSSANAAKLAALVPVCGTCSMNNASNIASNNLAVWAFHSSNDPRVSAACTKDAVDKINAANPKIRALYYPYTVASHSIWDMAYDDVYKWQNPHVFEWMLGQNKSITPNKVPSVSAGADVTISASTAKATVTGSGSDSDGSMWRYVWKKMSGPSGGTMADSTSRTLTVSGLTTAGTYVYRLTGVDNRVSWKQDEVKILVTSGSSLGNVSPIANAGADKTITLPTNSVSVSGSGSTDSDGSIASYQWTKVAGPSGGTIGSPTSVSTTISSLTAGTYTFRLTVKDNLGATDSDDMNVVVNGSTSNIAPTANGGGDKTVVLPTDYVSLSGSGSKDADGTIASYNWIQKEGPTTVTFSSPNSVSTTASGLKMGTYRFKLTVTDNGGLTSYDNVYVYVKAPPIAAAGKDISTSGSTASLSGTASTDPDGNIVRYKWQQLEGPTTATLSSPDGTTTSVSGMIKGTYLFRLKVEDNDGYADTDGLYVYAGGATASANLNTGSSTMLADQTGSLTVSESLSVAPNPAVSYTNLTISSATNGTAYINVFDINGRVVKKLTVNKSAATITQNLDVATLLAGTYQVQVIIGNAAKLNTRFIKQ